MVAPFGIWKGIDGAATLYHCNKSILYGQAKILAEIRHITIYTRVKALRHGTWKVAARWKNEIQ